MSIQEDLRRAEARPDDVLGHIYRDHAEIKELFSRVEKAETPKAKKEAFSELVRKLVVHETAEQEVVHPVVRTADGGDSVVDERLEEEKEGETVLSQLEELDVDDPAFDETFASLKQDVIDHAEAERDEEHPLLEQATDEAQLKRMKTMFEMAEKAAPTHPHPHGPTSAAGNIAVGPIVAIADRVRDAIAKARS